MINQATFEADVAYWTEVEDEYPPSPSTAMYLVFAMSESGMPLQYLGCVSGVYKLVTIPLRDLDSFEAVRAYMHSGS